MTFPVGVTTIQVTGQNVLDFNGVPLNGFVIFTPSGLIDIEAANVILNGSASAQVVNGVMTPVTLPTTDSATPAFTYTITLRLQNEDVSIPPVSGVSIPHSLGATVDLSSLV